MNNKNYNKTTSGASVQRAGQQGAFGTEFATETDVQSVRQANAQSQAKKSQASGAGQQGAFGTEFATETDVQSVRQANAQSQAKKSQTSSMNQSQQ